MAKARTASITKTAMINGKLSTFMSTLVAIIIAVPLTVAITTTMLRSQLSGSNNKPVSLGYAAPVANTSSDTGSSSTQQSAGTCTVPSIPTTAIPTSLQTSQIVQTPLTTVIPNQGGNQFSTTSLTSNTSTNTTSNQTTNTSSTNSGSGSNGNSANQGNSLIGVSALNNPSVLNSSPILSNNNVPVLNNSVNGNTVNALNGVLNGVLDSTGLVNVL